MMPDKEKEFRYLNGRYLQKFKKWKLRVYAYIMAKATDHYYREFSQKNKTGNPSILDEVQLFLKNNFSKPVTGPQPIELLVQELDYITPDYLSYYDCLSALDTVSVHRYALKLYETDDQENAAIILRHVIDIVYREETPEKPEHNGQNSRFELHGKIIRSVFEARFHAMNKLIDVLEGLKL